MTELAHTAWYRMGTASVTREGTTVTGNGTMWLTAGINPGATFRMEARTDYAAEVAEVISDTQLRLAKGYGGPTITNGEYSIDRNHQSTTLADLSARMASLAGKWEARYDLDMQTITGKSAYEVAVENGYNGTPAAWLESLKAAGELQTLQSTIAPLAAASHNCFGMWKKLGVPTPEFWAAIHNKTFTGLYPGAYFAINGHSYFILAVNTGAEGIDGNTNPYLLMYDYSPPDGQKHCAWFTAGNTAKDPCYDLSKWFVELRPLCEERLIEDFGEGHLLPWSVTCNVYDLENHVPTGTKNVSALLHLAGWGNLFGGAPSPFWKDGVEMSGSISDNWYHTNGKYLGHLNVGSGFGALRDVTAWQGGEWKQCHKYSGDGISIHVSTTSNRYHCGIFVITA